MKRVLLVITSAILALGMVPAHAKPGNGCTAVDQSVGGTGEPVASPGPLTCSYVASVTKATLVVATPNAVRITQKGIYDRTAKVLYTQAAGKAPGTYTLVTSPNKFIYITVSPNTYDVGGGQKAKAAAGLVDMFETS